MEKSIYCNQSCTVAKKIDNIPCPGNCFSWNFELKDHHGPGTQWFRHVLPNNQNDLGHKETANSLSLGLRRSQSGPTFSGPMFPPGFEDFTVRCTHKGQKTSGHLDALNQQLTLSREAD